jgi:hypothetical protein
LDSPDNTYSTSSVDGGSEKVLPSIPPTRSSTIESIDSELSLSSYSEKGERVIKGDRTTWTTVWSQDSAVTLSQSPYEEAMLACGSLVTGASEIKGDQGGVEDVPKKQEVPPALRPGNLVAKLSGIPPRLRI